MTMHLLPSFINSNGSGRRKPTAKQQRAKVGHDAWLRKMGLDPDTLAKKTAQAHKGKLQGNFVKDRNGLPCSNTFVPSGGKTSIFDSRWQDPYKDDPLMAEREALAQQQAEARKANLSPIYNKGPVMVVTPGLSPKDFGKRRP